VVRGRQPRQPTSVQGGLLEVTRRARSGNNSELQSPPATMRATMIRTLVTLMRTSLPPLSVILSARCSSLPITSKSFSKQHAQIMRTLLDTS
jgi:hypothetical protein